MENSKPSDVSDELLNAFVDNQLDAADKGQLLDLMVTDASGQLRTRVCELWQLKELVRSAYPIADLDANAPHRRHQPPTRWGGFRQALAAGVMLAVGATAGWWVRDIPSVANGVQMARLHGTEGKVILHLASSDPARLKAALDDVEELSQQRSKAGKLVQVELVANEGGLALFRADISPYAQRIESIGSTHQNVSFFACNNTIGTLNKAGVKVQLLPRVEVAPSVVEEILNRVQHGWTYVKV